MKSQIYENADCLRDIDQLFQDADAHAAKLAQDRKANAERRRALIEPTYKTVVANPTDIHHKIALGAVLVNIGLAAIDADALIGLLAAASEQVIAAVEEQMADDPAATFGKILIELIDQHERVLSARGVFETWQRRLAAYAEDRAQWLARDAEYRLGGAWRHESTTSGQRWLIRVTCRVRHIDLPGHLSRGDAADWLEAHGANLNYREFVA